MVFGFFFQLNLLPPYSLCTHIVKMVSIRYSFSVAFLENDNNIWLIRLFGEFREKSGMSFYSKLHLLKIVQGSYQKNPQGITQRRTSWLPNHKIADNANCSM